MFFLQGNVVVLPHLGSVLNVSDLYNRDALHHHPVFGALVVVLQTERFTGLHSDALYLVARLFFQGGIGAPWSMNRRRQMRALVFAFLELVDDSFDFLDRKSVV